MRIKRLATMLAAVLAMGAGATQAEEGGYVGGGLGQTRALDLQDSACSQLNGILDPGYSCSVDDSKTAFKLFGGYQFNPYIAGEISWVYLGDFEGSASGTIGGSPADLSFRYEVSGLSGDAVGTLPVTENFSFLGRVGVFLWDVRDIFDEHKSGVSLDYGAGVEYDFTRNVGLRADYVKYKDVGDNDIGKTDLDVTSLSLIYRIQ